MFKTLRSITLAPLAVLALFVAITLLFSNLFAPVSYAGTGRPHVNPTVSTVSAASLTAIDDENKEFLTCLSDKGAFVGALGTPNYVDMVNYYHDAKTADTQEVFAARLADYRTSKTKVAGTTGC